MACIHIRFVRSNGVESLEIKKNFILGITLIVVVMIVKLIFKLVGLDIQFPLSVYKLNQNPLKDIVNVTLKKLCTFDPLTVHFILAF